MNITIKEAILQQAAQTDMDTFVNCIMDAIKKEAGNSLNAENMQQLNADQITLWGYLILRDELMDGGFIQLIYNGYGPFFFDNPFAKAMRLWGLHDFSKLLYKAKKLYDLHKKELTQERNDEEFMALFEQHPEFDELDDNFIENEEAYTTAVAYYVDEHITHFVQVEK